MTIVDQIAAVDLSVLTLAEKVRLLTGASGFTLHACEKLGLQPMAFSDGPTGVRGLIFYGGEQVALFPNATVLASTWDEQRLREVGGWLAEEAERQHIHTVLGPTINLHRSPLGGRLFEQYSEDPLLTGKLAAAYVEGMQAHGVAACLKHFVANEAETLRNFVNSMVDEATLREVYLLAFEIALDAHPWSVMAAYNRVNGQAATEQQHTNQQILRGEWSYDGLLMSDWLATKTVAESANGGLDLVMPGPDGPWGKSLVEAVESGLVSESTIDEKVRRLLLLAARTGAWGDEPRTWTPGPGPSSTQRQRQLTELAAAGFTVLRNDGVLPLQPAQRLAVVGRPAVHTACMGGGSARVQAPHQVSIVEGLRVAGASPIVVDGWEVRERPLPASGTAIEWDGQPGMQAELLDASGAVMETRHVAEGQTGVGDDDDTPRPPVKAILSARTQLDGPQQIGFMGTGRWTLTAGDQRFEGLLQVHGNDPGEALFRAPYQVFEVDLPRGTELRAEVDLRPAEGVLTRRSGVSSLDDAIAGGSGPKTLVVRPIPITMEQVLTAAREAAQGAEVAVVCVGLTDEQETEGSDKATLALPAQQDRLVEAVAEVAAKTVVIVNAATPVLMPWADQVDAIMVIGLPGQEGGHAVAKTLFGELEPSGRLVTTWPAHDGASPAWSVVPDQDQNLEYREGRFVGYRGHQPFGLAATPAYWLGEGLGYGIWEYANPALHGRNLEVTVRNIGTHRSREVVQAYFAPAEVNEPVRLVGWTAVTVDPGSEERVTVIPDDRLWRRWDEPSQQWARLSGEGTWIVARGLGDVRCQLRSGAEGN